MLTPNDNYVNMIDVTSPPDLMASIALFYQAYRTYTSGSDALLAQRGLGRVHHRVLYYVARHPELTVSELLERLGVAAEMTADAGTYDEARDTVTIGPNVKISDGGSGFRLTTPEAVVDTNTGVVSGSKGVEGSGPLGTISASSYAIYEQGERVVFSGSGDNKVRGTMNAARSDR